ncbi:outer membrane beta-barrel protein [Allosphingosinicella sp.]|jgi:opacity protein-like surface antigen|uniref:outer membrane beta-barrel protein n=1 Tax=Allosphingosinicella sp. TaxID=2823234 RepID=UPI002EFB61B6
MKKIALMVSAAALTFAVPGVASAQEATSSAHPFVGVQVGLHDLKVDEDDIDTADFDIDDSAMTYGVYGGVDFDLGTSAVVGFEGNFSLGNGPIDSEYGVAARIGIRAGANSVLFARAGYQWINIDASGLIGVDEDLIDDDDLDVSDTIDDYIVGVGADIGFGGLGLRIAVDSVSMDTLRPSIGLHTRF